jgi:16S rRNA processing protein RimM
VRVSDDIKVKFGKFGKPHGVRGELRLWLFNPDTPVLDLDLELFVHVDGEWQSYVIDYVRQSNDKYAVVGLQDVVDRDHAAELTNLEVSIRRSEFEELDEEEFYQADLIGLPVYLESEDGREHIGKVKGFLDPLSDTDIMAVTGPRIQGRLLVLMTKEIVTGMSLEEGVTLAPLETWAPEDFQLKPA